MNNSFGISDKSYTLLQQTFNRYRQVEEVILFGSRAKGNFKPGSDIDLAVRGIEITDHLIMDLKSHINEELPIPYMIDVLNYNTLTNAELKSHIDRVGITFYRKEHAIDKM